MHSEITVVKWEPVLNQFMGIKCTFWFEFQFKIPGFNKCMVASSAIVQFWLSGPV